MLKSIKFIGLGLIIVVGFFSVASAEDISKPNGEIVLTVTGNVEIKNDGDKLLFDLESLQSLGNVAFETSTIWTDGIHKFEGVPLDVFLERIGAQGSTLRATAINDYTVEIPSSDAVKNGPIIAYLMDNKEMSIRTKGPLWIVYPYDSSDAYQSEVIYSRSIWQLDRIEVVN